MRSAPVVLLLLLLLQNVKPTWEGLVEPLERVADRLQRVWGTVMHLKARGRPMRRAPLLPRAPLGAALRRCTLRPRFGRARLRAVWRSAPHAARACPSFRASLPAAAGSKRDTLSLILSFCRLGKRPKTRVQPNTVPICLRTVCPPRLPPRPKYGKSYMTQS